MAGGGLLLPLGLALVAALPPDSRPQPSADTQNFQKRTGSQVVERLDAHSYKAGSCQKNQIFDEQNCFKGNDLFRARNVFLFLGEKKTKTHAHARYYFIFFYVRKREEHTAQDVKPKAEGATMAAIKLLLVLPTRPRGQKADSEGDSQPAGPPSSSFDPRSFL